MILFNLRLPEQESIDENSEVAQADCEDHSKRLSGNETILHGEYR